ncbi:type I-E CRISPR-associated protein Cse2/CasB [Amycolatopsis acidicola]|uniref:Type I-E CRISPR-associated protein Cse2/CasB n=1 Tax=Amycolatopsis acidicola TaxID=2596893 RepID=A0A5N0UXR5_9PSEU|nr:type I-E CRISPR-associated protein Cse2/CasB [Amycolatopsis acidicola]KAA9157935.1 type I-E CRISPR-associated protein Cse2/CasB [Amycolatopsis acidicola]
MSTPFSQRRDAFIKSLYALQAGAESGIPRRQSECRRTLAELRRGLASTSPQIGAYEVVFRHDPPEQELDAWLLIAGLFALHPQRGRSRGSLGTSMKALQVKRGDAAARRFEQLLLRNRDGLPHHVRQVIRLLASDDIPVNYATLLDDLVQLMSDGYRGDAAHHIRLRWARDFHTTTTTSSTNQDSASALEP